MAPVVPTYPIPIHRDARCSEPGCAWRADIESITFRLDHSPAEAVRNIMGYNRKADEALVEHLERFHATKPTDNIHVTVNVSGSVVTEKDLVHLIRNAIRRDGGGWRI